MIGAAPIPFLRRAVELSTPFHSEKRGKWKTRPLRAGRIARSGAASSHRNGEGLPPDRRPNGLKSRRNSTPERHGGCCPCVFETVMRRTSVQGKRVDDGTQCTSFMDRANPVGCRGGIAETVFGPDGRCNRSRLRPSTEGLIAEPPVEGRPATEARVFGPGAPERGDWRVEPDAGASAGDRTGSGAFGRGGRENIGCQVPVFGHDHASVRVGSAAMPAPFAMRPPRMPRANRSRADPRLVQTPPKTR